MLSFVLPLGLAALGSIPFLSDPAEWLDTHAHDRRRTEHTLTGHEWAQLGTSVALWFAAAAGDRLLRIIKGEIRAT